MEALAFVVNQDAIAGLAVPERPQVRHIQGVTAGECERVLAFLTVPFIEAIGRHDTPTFDHAIPEQGLILRTLRSGNVISPM